MLTIMVLTFSLMVCHAQVANQTIEQRIDSLQTQLDKLQRDYDFLNCELKLGGIVNNLSISSNKLMTQSNNLLIKCYHISYDRSTYKMYKEYYDVSLQEYLSARFNAYTAIDFVSLRIESCNFNKLEIMSLKASINTIEAALKSLKSNLDFFKGILDVYEEML